MLKLYVCDSNHIWDDESVWPNVKCAKCGRPGKSFLKFGKNEDCKKYRVATYATELNQNYFSVYYDKTRLDKISDAVLDALRSRKFQIDEVPSNGRYITWKNSSRQQAIFTQNGKTTAYLYIVASENNPLFWEIRDVISKAKIDRDRALEKIEAENKAIDSMPDKLGTMLQVGDWVCAGTTGCGLTLGKVSKFEPHEMVLEDENGRFLSRKISNQVIKVDQERMLVYILSN